MEEDSLNNSDSGSSTQLLEAITNKLDLLIAKSKIPYGLELTAAILLALATIGSTWSAYQATRWSGVQAISYSESSAARIAAPIASNRATSQILIDVQMFLDYVEAVNDSAPKLQQFIYERFRQEMKSAVDAWFKTKPIKNPDAPSSPFVMQEYQLQKSKEADSLLLFAGEGTEKAKEANQISDNYILLTVVFASVLFFGGVGPKFQSHKIKIGLTSLGLIIFTIALVILITFPIY